MVAEWILHWEKKKKSWHGTWNTQQKKSLSRSDILKMKISLHLHKNELQHEACFVSTLIYMKHQ